MKNHPISKKGGTLKIVTSDFKNYTFEGTLFWDECFLFEKDDVCESRIPFRGTVKNGNMRLYAFGKKLTYDSKKSLIWLDTMNVDLKQLLASKENYSNSAKSLRGKISISAGNRKMREDVNSLVKRQ